MEEVSNLRPYIEAVIQKWKWVAAGAILMALVALGVSFFLSPTYKATALVAVALPRQIVEFDNRITSTNDRQPNKSYPQLAKSDELLLSLLDEINPFAPQVKNLSQLRGLLSATPGLDPSLISLSASYGEPQIAAKIANRWAELFVIQANEVFGTQGDEQLGFFKDQLASASQELEQAEKDLIDFQARNRSAILENELASLTETQADYLTKLRQMVFILQDVEGFQNQLEGTGDGDISTAAQLAAIVLQLQAISGSPNSDVSTPLQLQVNLDQIRVASRQEQISFLSGLKVSMRTQMEEIEVLLVELEPQILTVQQDKQEAGAELARFDRDFSLAEETYNALALKVEEEQITSQITESGVRLASRSAVPEFPSGRPSRLLTIIAALAFGAALSIIVIVAITWWKNNFEPTT